MRKVGRKERREESKERLKEVRQTLREERWREESLKRPEEKSGDVEGKKLGRKKE